MKIVSHKLVGVSYRAAQSAGGEMKPTVIVLHDTAGRLDKCSSVRWFESPDCNTSAHFVVERDGTITQMVACNRKAWHAGASSFEGREGVNSFGIGIEIVNPGKLDAAGRAWFHKKTEKGFEPARLQHVKTKAHGDGYWMEYTAEQIEAVTVICKALALSYPITAITTHYEISPGRKIDPNPLFPLEELRAAVFSPAPAEEPAEAEVAISETVSAEPAELAAPQEEVSSVSKPGLLSSRNFARVNEMADQGSRIAGWIRSVKRWFWGTTATVGGATALIDTNKGSANAFTQMVSEHPFIAMAVAGAVVGLIVYVAIKVIERGLVSAYVSGRYKPRGA